MNALTPITTLILKLRLWTVRDYSLSFILRLTDGMKQMGGK